MRKSLVLLLLVCLAVPAVALTAVRSGEGIFSAEDGRGKVTVIARGGFIGRIDRGSIVITDLTPDDAFVPYVFGDDNPVRLVGDSGMQYSGRNVRFRLGGGFYRLVITAKGIDLSAVGVGTALIQGDGEGSGLYTTEGADCTETPGACKQFTDKLKVVRFGTGDRG